MKSSLHSQQWRPNAAKNKQINLFLKNLNVKPETLKLSEAIVGGSLVIGLSNNFLIWHQKQRQQKQI